MILEKQLRWVMESPKSSKSSGLEGMETTEVLARKRRVRACLKVEFQVLVLRPRSNYCIVLGPSNLHDTLPQKAE